MLLCVLHTTLNLSNASKDSTYFHVCERNKIYFPSVSDMIENDVNVYLQSKDTKKAESNKANIIDLVRTPVMRMYTIAIGFNWFLCGLCFYGVSQFIGQLGKIGIVTCFTGRF